MRIPNRLGLLAALTVLMLLATAFVVACGGDSETSADEGNGNGSENGAVENGTTGTGTGDSGTDADVVIVAKDNFFDPRAFSIPAGETVTVALKNEGAAIHNLILKTADAAGEDFMSDQTVNPGDTSTFEVQIDEPGTYEYVCEFHPNMTGELTVE